MERRLGNRVEAWLGPVAIAAFVEVGWIAGWPLALTPGGHKAARNGYGRDHLPIAVSLRPGGAYFWEGRVASL